MSSLTATYNSKVVQMAWMTRPIQFNGSIKGVKSIVNHEGILLTLENGKQYLLHIVPKTKAVLVEAKEMSSNW